ncbi:sulfatase [Mucilaginibacter mali]|uniref:Sulfatase n=1 Tax=Mucilaginibacter mali TaxID=2740462 RepID=A0A7D4UQ61_9SPHI|nr:sulfatase [Mucilaginibacter mali]QKJ32080.1 sulfatase [Mucilaginibacter mali]
MKKAASFLMLLLAVTVFAAVAQQGKKKYNVLFLISDDLRPEISCYDVGGIKTPNIDKIAARALRFDNAYAQYPVCNCSRSSLLTGRYPTQTGVMDNNTYFRRLHPDWVTLPQYFMNNGYVTLRSGKIFHGGIDDMVSWTEGGEPTNPAITERGNNARPARNNANPRPVPIETDGNGSASANSSSDRIIVLDGDGETHGDYHTATRAIDMMNRYKDKPFFLAVGFVKPHSPPTAPKKFFDLYDLNKIPLPVDYAPVPKAPDGLPPISIAPVNSDLFIGRASTPETAREMKRAYWASTSFMDAQLGRVMDALKQNKLEDNTIVVFFGDHGYHLGEKGKWSKGYSLYEIGLRVPLLIAIPGAKQKATKQVVQLLDLYPTLAELCGLPKPPDQEGHSLTQILKKPTTKRDIPSYAVVDYHGKTGKSVRTQRWHYAEWEEGADGMMLFDHPKDSLELKNLANDPAYAGTVQEMKALLKRMPDTRVKK